MTSHDAHRSTHRNVRAPGRNPRLSTIPILALLLLSCASRAGAEPVATADLDLESVEFKRQILSDGFESLKGPARPTAVPDIIGPGSVLNVGRVFMKVANNGFLGNPLTNVSSDPSGQWPGASSIEYLFFIGLAVGAVNPEAVDPKAVRRVSYIQEWRPPTLEIEDRMYRTFDGVVNGARFVNDDGDNDLVTGEPSIDEDFLDGRDNDGDGLIDEDHAALGQQLYSCVIRDDTAEATAQSSQEPHVPLGLRCEQKAWAYAVPGFQDFNVIEWSFTNISGHLLDSIAVAARVDMDAGPRNKSNYFQDDFDLPGYPSGEFRIPLAATDPRRQFPHDPALDNTAGEGPLCSELVLRVNGFAIADDDDDEGMTPGTPGVLLIDHTIDPLGLSGPRRVGWKSFRSFTSGTPYVQGGNPTIDQQRFELMTGSEGVDEETGFINAPRGDQKGDYSQWASVGPWRNVPNGGKVSVTFAFAVARGRFQDASKYAQDYRLYDAGELGQDDLVSRYPLLEVALSAQEAFEGIYERREGYPLTDYHGREWPLRLGRGQPVMFMADCRDEAAGRQRPITELGYTWFDFDCDYCTGVYVWGTQEGLFHKTWNAEAPPPNPNLNVASEYNFTDNPYRDAPPAGDGSILLAWDNLSQASRDPKSGWFDTRGYEIWKVSGWTRPVGSPGPGEDDWTLVGKFRLFEYYGINGDPIQDNRLADGTCPIVQVPNWTDPVTGVVGQAEVPMCLEWGDLWDRQSGIVLRPDTTVRCVGYPNCEIVQGCRLGSLPCLSDTRVKYPIGRFRFVDREVKNGFTYFYSVTAFDSTGSGPTLAELSGRRSAVEAEGVSPQTSTRAGRNVWVVPNPYRGYRNIGERPSSWDLTPNASDPTGTHIDFFGLPSGQWTIKIFTLSGDLVQTIRHTDAVNASIRGVVTGDDGVSRDGTTRQQDTPNDGQARWNLISRNGQDVVSGIYLFTVESSQGTQRGKFVIIR